MWTVKISNIAGRGARFCESRHKRQWYRSSRAFHHLAPLMIVKPFLLADIGEGITECQLIQWFVQTGARVEQFDKICEVQSDKASVEITSPYDGVITKLHYCPDDMAVTGRPLIDIDIDGSSEGTDNGKTIQHRPRSHCLTEEHDEKDGNDEQTTDGELSRERSRLRLDHLGRPQKIHRQSGEGASSLATPAVRHLIREHNIDIATVRGTGRDGRVMKDDVHKHISGRSTTPNLDLQKPRTDQILRDESTGDREVELTSIQSQMFKTMTRSMSIPHFLYTSSADMTTINEMRKKVNVSAGPDSKITNFAFLLKAVSLALFKYPLLNASLLTNGSERPTLTYHQSQHIGMAVDTPRGLFVPVIHDIQELSILAIADKVRQLAETAKLGKLTPQQLNGATFTVSNIGSIGGGVVAPVISIPQVAILGVGRSRSVPAFDDAGNIRRKEELTLSWSADHRVVNGAECARCAEAVIEYLENPESMLVIMR